MTSDTILQQFKEKEIYDSLDDKMFETGMDITQEVENELKYVIQSKEPFMEDYKDSIIIIDNLPIIPVSKLDSLRTKLQNMCENAKLAIESLSIPADDTKSKGYAFIKAESTIESSKIRSYFNNLRLSAQNVLKSYTLSQRDDILSKPDHSQTKEAVKRQYDEMDGINIFLNNNDETLAVLDTLGNASIYNLLSMKVYFRYQDFSTSKIEWSPQGTYLVGFGDRGIMLTSASTKSNNFRKFTHNNVSFCLFSPCERYMMTYSSTVGVPTPGVGIGAAGNIGDTTKMSVFIWDVNFNVTPIKTLSGTSRPPSLFKWSHDGAYLSYVFDDLLYIFDAVKNQLVDRKPMKIPNIQSVYWANSTNVLVYWELSQTESPSHIVCMSIPSMEKRIVSQNYHLDKCRIEWHDSDNFLALIQTRAVKKSFSYSVEIANVTQKESSVDTIACKTAITDFGWEPFGNTFVVVWPPNISVYKHENNSNTLLKTVEGCGYDCVIWAPFGKLFIVAKTKPDVIFEVYHCDGKHVTVLGRGQHSDANYIAWDSVGRHFITASNGLDSSDSRIKIWSCVGYVVDSRNISALSFILWRPHPKRFLSTQQVEEIWTNIESYTRKYSQELKSVKIMANQSDVITVNLNILFPTSRTQLEHITRIASHLRQYREKVTRHDSSPITLSRIFNLKSM